ncbi:nitroreductase family protein [Lacrimispora sp.]|uniref:nitroreductase family protein n=1 Tax=Lacrimispora sp. TaxID=2719234 RepID=UPI0028AE6715|nr:nitroreductase family protein [Lacrimispora sp.]
MTLYETIFVRRQVRKYNKAPLEKKTLENILQYATEADQLVGQYAKFEIASADAVNNGQSAPYYLLSYCDDSNAAYANVGYVLQKANLYIQSIGLGSGWFMNPKPKDNKGNYCIALAFGGTDIPVRKNLDEFKRLPVKEISQIDNAVARAVRLAPSAMNSQPWKLNFEDGKIIIKDLGRGIMRVMLRNKLNKIDIGIAARHAVTALEQDGEKVTGIIPKTKGKEFKVEILYEQQ